MQPLPEKIKQLEVEIGGAVRGQLLKHSIYEFRYLDSEVADQPAVGLLMPPSHPTYRDGDLFAVMDQHLPEGDLFMRLRALSQAAADANASVGLGGLQRYRSTWLPVAR